MADVDRREERGAEAGDGGGAVGGAVDSAVDRDGRTATISSEREPPRPVGQVWRLVRLALPIVAASLVTYVVSVNDTVLLGRSGAAAVAASSAATGPVFTTTLFLAGFSVAVQIIVARRVGAGEDGLAARTAAAAARFVLLLSAGLAGALAVSAAVVLGVLADGPGFPVDLAAAYLRVLAIGLPVGAVAAVLRGYAVGVGRSRVVFAASLATAGVDIGLALLLLGLGAGPLGVAVATVAGSVTGLAVMLGWLARAGLSLRVRALLRLDREGSVLRREVWRTGWPEGVRGAANAGATVVVVVLLAPAGAVALAADRAVAVPVLLAWAVLYGVGTAVTTVAAQSLGAGDAAAYATTRRAAVLTVVPIAATVVLTLAPLTPLLAGLLVDDRSAVEAASLVAPLAWAQVGWMAAVVVLSGLLRAHRDTRGPLWASLVAEYAVFLPVGWLLARSLELGLVGVYLAHQLFWLTFTVLLAVRLRRRERTVAGR